MEEVGGGGVRLHVGGLGESVGRDDLIKIFSPMGSVDTIEFVRTKGRSFAYIDFSPSSVNSLTKLFSTYNGCVWKGGRLRLEKAKEHYLARLKREWEEASCPKSVEASENSTPSTHINMFFPRLRKVKAMPLSGTGKHKYSFQRVVLPSTLPKSFCDCEEHFTSLNPKESSVCDLEEVNVGVNEKEVNIMNSVMNKLFQAKNIPKGEKKQKAPEEECEKKVHEEDSEQKALEEDSEQQAPEEESEIEADEDGLIINVASKGNDMMNLELDILSRKRKSILNETTASGEKGNQIHPTKKRKSVVLEESGRQESPQAIREKKKAFEVDTDKSLENPTKTTGVKKSSDNISWSQKSSWKALMGNGNSSSFSVSSFLPGGGPIIETSEDLDVPSSTSRPTVKSKNKKTKSKGDTDTDISVEDEPLDLAESIEGDNDNENSDHSEDIATDISGEDEAMEFVASPEGDSDSENSDHSEDIATDISGEDETMEFVASPEGDSENEYSDHSEGTATDVSGEDEAMEFAASTEGDSENENSDHLEDNATDVSTEGDSADDNLNMENDENVAEDLNAEKESSALKENVDEEETGKGPLEASSKSAGSSSWLQRASWTQLVSDKNTSSSFSITQLFPGLTSDKSQAATVSNNGDGQFPNSNQSETGMTQKDYLNNTGSFVAAGVHVDSSTPTKSLEVNRNGKNVSEGFRLVARKPIRRNVGSGETCTFMRSSASLREWAKAKKALTEPRRKKKREE